MFPHLRQVPVPRLMVKLTGQISGKNHTVSCDRLVGASAPETLGDSSSGSGLTCGWGEAGTPQGLPSKVSLQSGGVFIYLPILQRPWVGQRRLSPRPFRQHPPGARGGRKGGAQRGLARPPHPSPGAPPPLAGDSSAGAGGSCQPVASRPGVACAPARLPPAGSPDAAPRPAPPRALAPACPDAPAAGGSATSPRFPQKIAEPSPLVASTEGRGWRPVRKGSGFPRLLPLPGEERPESEGSAWKMEQTWTR